MTGLRLTFTALPMALAAMFWAAPSQAQNTAQPAPASNDVIGPSELRNFDLKGPVRQSPPTVVAPATVPARTSPPATTATPTRQPPPRTAGTASEEQPSPPAASPAPRQIQPQAAAPPRAAPASGDAASSVTFALPSLDGATPATDTAAAPVETLGSQPGLVPVTPPESASIPLNSGPPLWPWLVAALLAGVGVLYYGRRQRARRATAGAPVLFDAPRPAPAEGDRLERAPPPPPRAAAPRPVVPPEQPVSSRIPGVIVSTRLRPRLDIQFVPERLIVDQERTTLRFAAMLFNSGNAPALDILVEAAMFNAGADQDEQIAAFFAHPLGQGDRVKELQPLKGMTLRSEVVLPTAGLRLFDVEGRKLFVPFVGFNALYRWSDKTAQTSESFIVGVDTQGEKMGPFHLDGSPRQFRKVATRPHSVRLRK